MKKEIKPLSGGPYGMKIILLAGKPKIRWILSLF